MNGEVRFALDSPLEGDGFELLVPRHESPAFPKHRTFKSEPLYVRRALRVECTYGEQNWDKTDYLIVLYQCSGGCC